MSSSSPRVLRTPSRKRKERDVFYPPTSSKQLPPQTAATTSSKGSQPQPQPKPKQQQQQPQPLSSNRLLAGCMAYEFLTNGTLFGQKFDPARAEAVPVNSVESKRNRVSQISWEAAEPPRGKSTPHSYAEVAHVLKSEGAHIPGVVNPSQLAKWIQM